MVTDQSELGSGFGCFTPRGASPIDNEPSPAFVHRTSRPRSSSAYRFPSNVPLVETRRRRPVALGCLIDGENGLAATTKIDRRARRRLHDNNFSGAYR